eukprot:CAMPEP_0170492502 /NCGR_PEP_ID=MMETSP0208-20121228/12353_1 /TAXON_ID=197538 /ORGANISM="Strombidium inclinatum, Strain S3" /LENGTH=120 /DNA_ID=CAMNT_0010768253 /DNA_START=1883 /DNA_END=2245 /DNA_ORIENTATION=+
MDFEDSINKSEEGETKEPGALVAEEDLEQLYDPNLDPSHPDYYRSKHADKLSEGISSNHCHSQKYTIEPIALEVKEAAYENKSGFSRAQQEQLPHPGQCIHDHPEGLQGTDDIDEMSSDD